MDHFLIPTDDENNWKRAVKGIRHPFTHQWEYGRAMERSSGLKTFLYVGKDGSRSAICLLSVREKEGGVRELVSPYGFGGIVSDFTPEKLEALRSEWVGFCGNAGFVTAYIMQHPLFPLDTVSWQGLIEDYHVLYLLDLRHRVEDLWARMGNTHRYEIRRLEGNHAAKVVTDKTRLTTALKTLYPETMGRVRASSVYFSLESSLDQLTKTAGALLIGVETADGVQNVSLFLHTSCVAEYFLSASSAEGRKYSRQVLWSAVILLKDLGVEWMNMGGGVKPGDTLDQFKRRFGGVAVNGQVVKVVFNQERYNSLCNKYCVGYEGRTSFFPPYWAPPLSILGDSR